MYLIVKQFHIILVILSVALFQIRYWRYHFHQHPTNKLIKIIPHVIDTLLLSAGLALLFMAGFSITSDAWLGVKLIAVVMYILLGFIAMKTAGWISVIAYLSSTLTVLYIMIVAHLKTPLPFP